MWLRPGAGDQCRVEIPASNAEIAMQTLRRQFWRRRKSASAAAEDDAHEIAALRAPILSMMRGRWTSTVRGLMPSRRPASLLEAPPAISASTSHSRGVRLRPGKSTNAPFLLLAFSNRSEKASMAPLTRDKENDDSIAGQRENDRECIVHHRIVITMRRLRVPGVSEAITASLQISVRSILQRQRHEVK